VGKEEVGVGETGWVKGRGEGLGQGEERERGERGWASGYEESKLEGMRNQEVVLKYQEGGGGFVIT